MKLGNFVDILFGAPVFFLYELFKPKPPKQEPPNLADFPITEQGIPIPLLYGTRLIENPIVANYWDLRIVAAAKEGGKKQ